MKSQLRGQNEKPTAPPADVSITAPLDKPPVKDLQLLLLI